MHFVDRWRALATPQLRVFDGASAVIATNAGWNDDPQIAAAAAKVGAFTYAAGSKDAALLVTLAPQAWSKFTKSRSDPV